MRRGHSAVGCSVHAQSRDAAADDHGTHEALLQKWSAGDDGAVRIAWDLYGDTFTHRLEKRFRPLLAPDECEEIVCDALERAWEHWAQFLEEKGRFEAWLWRITYRRAAEEVRESWCKERRSETSLMPDELFRVADRWWTERDEETTHRAKDEVIDLIHLAMAVLTEGERLVLEADMNSDAGGASTAELAQELGVSTSAIRSYRARARAKLKAQLIALGYVERVKNGRA